MAYRGPKSLLRVVNETLRVYGAAFILSCLVLLFVPSWVRGCFYYGCGLLFLTSVLGSFVEDWRPKGRIPTSGKAVFITGCDSGFGHSLAQRMDDMGLQVFAGCLFPEGEGAKDLKKSASSRLHVVSLDITSEDSIGKARKYVDENIKDYKLWAVVNNAGLNDGGEIFWTNLNIIEKVMSVNTMGMVKVTKAFLTLLCRDKGRVVNVASAAGRFTYAGMVPYCMSKHAAVSFSDGLRLEMYRFGVKVVTIEPWMYKTPITKNDYVQKYLTRTWEQATDEVKAFQPEGFLKKYIKMVNVFLNYSISDRPQQVVDCMEEAILALNPKFVYNPGTLFSRFSFWFIARLPKPIADYALIGQFPVPDYE